MTSRAGFILVESAITYIVLVVGIMALAPLFAMMVKGNEKTQYVKTATQLSQELMEEVLIHRWDEKTPTPAAYVAAGSAIGIDSGETAADKRTFDDIDDFNGWAESSVKDPMLQPVAGLTDYARQVSVYYVDATNTLVAGPTDYKQVHVCTTHTRMAPVCLDALATNR
jgi:Tfp pilus assembly protein PilV